MSIIDIVTQIVAQIQSGDSPPVTPRFYFGEEAFANLTADDQIFPAVYLDIPLRFRYTLADSGYLQIAYELELYFLDKSELDYNEIQHNAIVQEMIDFSEQFVQRASDHAEIRFIDDLSGYGFKNLFDVNVSGVLLKITLTPFNRKSIC